MGPHTIAVDVALPDILSYCDGIVLGAAPAVSRCWRRTFCSLNASQQALFRSVCLQQWPWLRDSLTWSHCGHHLWHNYLGNWQALCCDGNRCNSALSLELAVPLDVNGYSCACIHGPWVEFPFRDFKLRINAYPVGNRRMTNTHLSAYLEVLTPPSKDSWHAALDFTFVVQHPGNPDREISWSSGPVRFMENSTAGAFRLDWGCHELIPLIPGAASSGKVLIKANVALQDALVEVVHIGTARNHINDFGFSRFPTYCRPGERAAAESEVMRITVPASTTRAELLNTVAETLGQPVTRLWRFSRALESQGRLACTLPESPRHLLADAKTATEDDAGVYALLTKWTLGESAGGARQNFFRVLAEGPNMPWIPPADASMAMVFVKVFTLHRGLRFEGAVHVPRTDKVLDILPAILDALALPETPMDNSQMAEEWCLAWEGSPCDWAEAPVGCRHEDCMLSSDQATELINSHGCVVQGDIIALCQRSLLPELSTMYRHQYLRRVDDFRMLAAREATQVGSVIFSDLCKVMDSLNVDPWRLEQLLGGSCGPGSVLVPGAVFPATATSVTGTAKPRPTLALIQSLPGLHPQFFCDVCGNRELRGYRYNCLVCSDFDLCEECYLSQPEMRQPTDHNGRYHEKSHKMTRSRPAIPANCIA